MKLNPPPHLGKPGRDLWSLVRAEYQIDDSAALALLTNACECLDRIREAQKAIGKNPVVKDRYGSPKLHPACQLERDSRAGMMAALKALNLDLEPVRSGPGRPPARISLEG